jgi:hypothetical protein
VTAAAPNPYRELFGDGIKPPILAAWERRGDFNVRDALWRAACWDRSGISSLISEHNIAGARQAFERAHEILATDPAAVHLVADYAPRRAGYPPPTWLAGVKSTTTPPGKPVADWPRAKRASWG